MVYLVPKTELVLATFEPRTLNRLCLTLGGLQILKINICSANGQINKKKNNLGLLLLFSL